MKKTLTTLLALLMVLALATGCAQQAAPAPSDPGTSAPSDAGTAAPGAQEESLRVALMISGTANDGGWNTSAVNGLQMIKDTYGAETQFIEGLSQSDFEEMFRSFASEGYDVIFGHGYEFGDAAMKVAPEFPDVKFIITSTNIHQEPNLASMNTLPSEMGLIQGTAAAYATKSNIIGAIGGMSIPSITDPLNTFAAGAKAVNPDIKVILNLTGDFEDAAKAKEVAQAFIEQGADVIMLDADAAGLGVLEAVKGTGVLAIPSIANQNDLAPENCLLSGICDVPKGMLYVFSQIVEGKFAPTFYKLGADTGCVYYEPNEAIYGTYLDEAAQAAVEDVYQQLKAGTLDAYAQVEALVPPAERVG